MLRVLNRHQPDKGFSITSRAERGALILAVKGKIDGTTAPEFTRGITSAVDSTFTSVVLDMSGCEYLSSAALRSVLLAARTVETQGLPFAMCALRKSVRSVFEVVGFDQLLKIYPSLKKALAAELGA